MKKRAYEGHGVELRTLAGQCHVRAADVIAFTDRQPAHPLAVTLIDVNLIDDGLVAVMELEPNARPAAMRRALPNPFDLTAIMAKAALSPPRPLR